MAAVLHSVKKVKFITKQNHYVKMKLKIYQDLRMVITKVMEMNNTTFPDNELFCLQYPPAWHTKKAFHGLFGLLGDSQRFHGPFGLLGASQRFHGLFGLLGASQHFLNICYAENIGESVAGPHIRER